MEINELLSINIIPEEIEKSLYSQEEQGLVHTAYKDEIRILSCIMQGDINRLFSEIKSISQNGIFVGKLSANDTRQYKYMAVSFITLATRYAIQGGMPEIEAYSFSDDFIRTVDTIDTYNNIMNYTAQKAVELTNKVKASKNHQNYSPNVKKCIMTVEKKLNKKLTVHAIAKEIGISADYLSHIFKKETDENLGSYILRKKLEVAKTLIWEGCSPSYACNAMGFSANSHFITCFKKQFGITPKEYQNSLKHPHD